jgi:hypothetical protein
METAMNEPTVLDDDHDDDDDAPGSSNAGAGDAPYTTSRRASTANTADAPCTTSRRASTANTAATLVQQNDPEVTTVAKKQRKRPLSTAAKSLAVQAEAITVLKDIQGRSVKDEGEIDHFFKWTAAMVKSMPETVQDDVKDEVYKTVMDAKRRARMQ